MIDVFYSKTSSDFCSSHHLEGPTFKSPMFSKKLQPPLGNATQMVVEDQGNPPKNAQNHLGL